MKRKPEREEGAPPDPKEIRTRALGLLARREHSTLELKRKLLQRGYPAELVAPVLAELSTVNLLSETRYADEWVRSRIARGRGPMKIRAELRQRGLTDIQIQQALANAEVDWGRLAIEARRKRFGRGIPATLGERVRQTRFLESRGFGSDQIREALGDAQD